MEASWPFADLVLKCESGDQVRTSKAILGLWSPVFRDLLQSVENVEEVALPNRTAEEMNTLLKYLYPPYQTSCLPQDAEILLSLAHEYDIAKVKQLAEDKIADAILVARLQFAQSSGRAAMAGSGEESLPEDDTFERIAHWLEVATRYEAETVRAACGSVLRRNPSARSALLAEGFRCEAALNASIDYIAQNFQHIILSENDRDVLEQLSSQTLLKIMARSQQYVNAAIAAKEADLHLERQKFDFLKTNLSLITFTDEERRQIMSGGDWRDLNQLYTEVLDFYHDIHVSRSIRTKLDEVISETVAHFENGWE